MTNKQRLTAELAALLLIGLVVAGRSGSKDEPVPDVVRSHRFELVDKTGKVRCDIRVDCSDLQNARSGNDDDQRTSKG